VTALIDDTNVQLRFEPGKLSRLNARFLMLNDENQALKTTTSIATPAAEKALQGSLSPKTGENFVFL
jgi:hypothetical protein